MLTLQPGRLKLIFELIYVPFRQIHREELQQETDLTFNMPTALRPPALQGLQRFHYTVAAQLLPCRSLSRTWQQRSIVERTPSTEEAVITVPPFCWSARQSHKRK